MEGRFLCLEESRASLNYKKKCILFIQLSQLFHYWISISVIGNNIDIKIVSNSESTITGDSQAKTLVLAWDLGVGMYELG